MLRTKSRIATISLAASVSIFCFAPTSAQAATYAELHERVLEATSAYDEALQQVERVKADIKENESEIAQIEAELPVKQERAAESMRTLYKMQQSSQGLVELMLSSDSFGQFISTITYLEHIQGKYLSDLRDVMTLKAKLQETTDLLNARKIKAEQEAQAALEARDEAQLARDNMYMQYTLQAQAEYEEAQAALQRAAEEAAQNQTFTTASGRETQVSVPAQASDDAAAAAQVDESAAPEAEPQQDEGDASAQDAPAADETPAEDTPAADETPDTPAADESDSGAAENPAAGQGASDSDAYVQEWAGRIDKYLAGSPLEGYGSVFAEAAYANGVDPRVSPAIATVESGQGAICFREHNAWGWGNESYDDWESAIWSQVSGYASNYGPGVTYEGAQSYCPPTADEWYSSVNAEMDNI